MCKKTRPQKLLFIFLYGLIQTKFCPTSSEQPIQVHRWPRLDICAVAVQLVMHDGQVKKSCEEWKVTWPDCFYSGQTWVGFEISILVTSFRVQGVNIPSRHEIWRRGCLCFYSAHLLSAALSFRS